MSNRKLPHLYIFLLLFFVFSHLGFSQVYTRQEIDIPNIDGYLTLKCDFHTHTVFSDGTVCPIVRAQEAWLEGLDVIAISDHIEYQPHKEGIPTNHKRAHEIAQAAAKDMGILCIRGAEITRDIPPRHSNASFLENVDPLDTDEISASGSVTLHGNRTPLLRVHINFRVKQWSKEFTLSGIVKKRANCPGNRITS